VSCLRIALAAGEWTAEQKQAIAAAAMARALRLSNITGLGAPTEIAPALLALAADYSVRLAGLVPLGSPVMQPAAVPTGLQARLAERVERALAAAARKAR
jgi:hypothetical protein